MRWNVDSNTLGYPCLQLTTPDKLTKREILSQSSKIFDPLGFLSPVSIRGKIFMQELWKHNYTWDQELPENVTEKWKIVSDELRIATSLNVARYIPQQQDIRASQLHIFTDASPHAYGACAYLVNGENSTLLLSKNRVTPLKETTLPRMELLGAVIGVQLAEYFESVLNTNLITLWCDSQIVLHWLKSDKPLKKFISNRVTQIKELTGKHSWRYVPTNSNPADLQTRGISAKELLDNPLWIHGPKWIINQPEWPIWDPNSTTKLMISQVKEHGVEEEIQQEECEQAVPHILTLSNYSSYQKLLRITAFILRFANNCRQSKNDRICGDIISQELNQASKYWIKVVQQESYGDVKESLNNTKRNHLIRQLKLFMDSNGLIRYQGRIHNAPLPDDTKFPLLLPKSHAFTKLIIEDTHRRNLHCGPEATIVTLREKFWIPSIRQEVRNCLRKCVPCRKVTGKSFLAPDPPPLPKDRLKDTIYSYRSRFYRSYTCENEEFEGQKGVHLPIYLC
ncbi:uncharacterized protein [Argopecten irradians]|uniref:uncharacterized protein n=1 Tax=Argopecten irradians TaxID=31199 RepID=UPI003712A7DE